jgi:hypothetical protein
LTGADWINSHAHREPTLINSGLVIERSEHPKLKRRQVLRLGDLRKHAHTYLLKPTREVRRHAMHRRHRRAWDGFEIAVK